MEATDFKRTRFVHWFGWGKPITGGNCDRQYTLPKYQIGVIPMLGCRTYSWRLIYIRNHTYNGVKLFWSIPVSFNIKYKKS